MSIAKIVIPISSIKDSDISRFNTKFRVERNGCWIWTDSLNIHRNHKKGIFSLQIAPKTHIRVVASRFAWVLSNGQIPKDMLVCHTCDRGECVNPEHLFIGTQKDNMQDAKRKNRNFVHPLKKRCNRGHSAYTIAPKLKKRYCKKCAYYHSRKYILNKRLEQKFSFGL